MAKSKQPPSDKIMPAADPAAPSRNTGHPLLRSESHMMEVFQRGLAAEKQEEKLIEQVEDWKLCINRVAATADGQQLLRNMFKFAGYFSPEANAGNGVKLVEMEGRRKFYSLYVRPYLEPKLRKEIE